MYRKPSMKCSPQIAEDMNIFMQNANLPKLYLFGGAVLDPLLNENAKINDYDVCVKDEEDFYTGINALREKGYNVADVVKTHNIYVVIKDQNGMQFDFSCMDPEDNGILSLEKIYAEFPANKIIDKYDSIGACRRQEIRLASNPKKEGAYNVLRRFLAAAQKYHFPIHKGSRNQEIIDTMKAEFKTQTVAVKQDKVRCLDRLIKILAKEKNKERLLKDFAEQEILKDAFPNFHNLFCEERFRESEPLKQLSDPGKLLNFIIHYHPNGDFRRDELVNSAAILLYREKARAHPSVIKTVNDSLNEKTSVARLNREILTPLLFNAQKRGR